MVERDSEGFAGLTILGWGVDDMIEDCGVSIAISSLTPEELSRGKVGGGVRILSSKLVQNPRPAECLIACCVNVLDEDRLLADLSLPMVMSSGISPKPSVGPAVAGWITGDG